MPSMNGLIMIMSLKHVCLTLLLILSLKRDNRVIAYPTQAGHCQKGAAIGDASNGMHGSEGSGSLQEGGFQVRIGSSRLLTSNDTTNLLVGENYTITLESTDGQSVFRGFLFRLSGLNGEDLQEALGVTDNRTWLLPSTGEAVGLSAACSPGVAGLTHNARVDKTSIVSDLRVDTTAGALLEVTVVTNNQGGGQNDWYYSSYELSMETFASDTPQPSISLSPSTSNIPSLTPSTSMSPTSSQMPSSGDASMIPSLSPSNPSMGVSVTPSSVASAIPSIAPSNILESSPPSLSESSPPSLTPTQITRDSAVPSMAPIVDKDPSLPSLYECKWWCALIPTPWISSDPDAYPKCDWTYSCSICPQCTGGNNRMGRRRNKRHRLLRK